MGAGARYGDSTEKGAVGPVGGDICWPVMTQRGFMVYEREGHWGWEAWLVQRQRGMERHFVSGG